MSVAHQAAEHFSKIHKGDDDNSDFADSVDLSALDLLVNATPADLQGIAADSGRQGLIQLGIENEQGLVNQVDNNSLAYAKDRAAEMVGKKWVDGRLVDNPDAQWVITDATRDEINDLIVQVQSGDLAATDLPKALMDADAFSADRANMIARTELMAANGQGSLASYKSARDIGVKVKKAWYPDEGACPICLANADDGSIDLDADFSSGDDAPPAHPNCECVLIPEVEEETENDAEDGA